MQQGHLHFFNLLNVVSVIRSNTFIYHSLLVIRSPETECVNGVLDARYDQYAGPREKKYGFDSKIPLQKSVVKSQHVFVACGFV